MTRLPCLDPASGTSSAQLNQYSDSETNTVPHPLFEFSYQAIESTPDLRSKTINCYLIEQLAHADHLVEQTKARFGADQLFDAQGEDYWRAEQEVEPLPWLTIRTLYAPY